MSYCKKILATGIVGLTASFGASTMDDATVNTKPEETEVIQSWYDRIRPLSFIRDPEEQCVPVHRLQDSANEVFKDKAAALFETMDRTAVTQKIADDFRAQKGAACFVDFEKEYGEDVTAAAIHFTDYNAILLNLNSNEGCLVSASVHELQHSAQKYAGYPAPLRDLTIHEQDKYVLAIEVDAHVTQTLGSWMLAQSEYSSQPYEGALNCLKQDTDGNLPYLKDAAYKLDNIATQNPDWIKNGQAARLLYEDFYNNDEIHQRYLFPIRFMYICMDSSNCFREQHTLQSLGIDMEGLGKIHHKTDYRAIPLHKPKAP